MAAVAQRRMLITALVTLATFLVAFKPVRFGPFEEFRVELKMRYRFVEPISKLAKDQPMEQLVRDALEKAKFEKPNFVSIETVGEHLLVIEDDAAGSMSEALERQEKIDSIIRKHFPSAQLIEAERQAKGEKPLWQIGRIGIFKPAVNLRLGLDLQGGSRIVLQCRRAEFVFELDKPIDPKQREAARETITAALERRGLENFDVQVEETGKIVFVRSQATPREAESQVRLIETTLRSLYGGARELKERRQFFPLDQAKVNTVREIVERRINRYGVSEPQVYVEGTDRVVVEMPGVRNPEEALRLIGEMGELEFRSVPEKYRVEVETSPTGEKERVIFRDSEGKEVPQYQVYAESTLVVKGTELSPPTVIGYDQFGRPEVHLTFNREGARKFADFTRRNVGKHLAIWYDRECISAPVVQEPILDGRARITGIGSFEEANLLKVILDAGALPVPVSVLWRQSISPTLGIDTIHKSINAGILAAILIAAFMIGYYRLPGVLACVALTIYFLIVLAVMSLQIGDWRPVLTLPGIVGLIVSLGMAVDVNVISFERLKEELRAGRPLRIAVEAAFDRSWTAILDAHVTVLIAAAVLYYFGTGPVKGFATTLTIGTLANLFSAFFSVRGMMEWVVRTRLGERVELFRTFADVPAVQKLLTAQR
ncbi:protein translocase subunit SecD [Fervidibacter sacchari]|uniref:Protein translocase subunit SecD n=1 Tax=Candidatus Fervidibacter sacchari TaxID=1448929 RepID=A0ABT2EM38_9BACT|nr:protein translocase subunit SecD [Candidatus Fervidibacter sacchari]MCS3919008.1 preprotein translocase subunit SecD [Candidatus Fervidibacter sacchari]WKU17256.1 protein translocase subunit SecD [Candidatus Fervidibacter sacchari]